MPFLRRRRLPLRHALRALRGKRSDPDSRQGTVEWAKEDVSVCRASALGANGYSSVGKPMKREIYECDNCGAFKRDVNHWHLIQIKQTPDGPIFQQFGWFEVGADRDGNLSACGQACASAMHSRWMRTGNLIDVNVKNAVAGVA